jgi:hypothetical protein
MPLSSSFMHLSMILVGFIFGLKTPVDINRF